MMMLVIMIITTTSANRWDVPQVRWSGPGVPPRRTPRAVATSDERARRRGGEQGGETRLTDRFCDDENDHNDDGRGAEFGTFMLTSHVENVRLER
jgi:hypothetical protein